MAIHDWLPGISATILCNGDPIPEITDPDPPSPPAEDANARVVAHHSRWAVSKYIVCESGRHFAIKLTVDAPYNIDCAKLAFYIYVDGKFAARAWCERPQLKRAGGSWEQVVEGVKMGKGARTTERDFKFVDIKLGEL
jgi:hypothetical protein